MTTAMAQWTASELALKIAHRSRLDKTLLGFRYALVDYFRTPFEDCPPE